MWRKIFRLHTKTFGGKIWFDLHRVSPGNVFDKNLNKAFFKISHQKIFKQQLVHKIVLWLYKNSKSRYFRQNELHQCTSLKKEKYNFCTRYHDIYIYKDSKLKSTMARYEQLKRNCLFTLKFLNQSMFLAHNLPWYLVGMKDLSVN